MHLLLLSLGVTSNVVKRNEDVFYIIVDQKLATDSESFLPLDKIKKIKLKFVFQFVIFFRCFVSCSLKQPILIIKTTEVPLLLLYPFLECL